MIHTLLDKASIDDGLAMGHDGGYKWHQISKQMMKEKMDEPTKRTNRLQQTREKNHVLY